jgi:phosphopantothenoylcysteine decarboxylase/phosphopantothenate--cysteine ligase
MVKNIDIADEFGRVKTPDQVSVGFALETNDELKHAMGKLVKKNFDMVIMNSMNDPNATFWFDTNKITIVRNDFTKKEFSLKSKTEVAQDIVNEIAEIIHDNAHYEKGTFDYEMLYL